MLEPLNNLKLSTTQTVTRKSELRGLKMYLRGQSAGKISKFMDNEYEKSSETTRQSPVEHTG